MKKIERKTCIMKMKVLEVMTDTFNTFEVVACEALYNANRTTTKRLIDEGYADIFRDEFHVRDNYPHADGYNVRVIEESEWLLPSFVS